MICRTEEVRWQHSMHVACDERHIRATKQQCLHISLVQIASMFAQLRCSPIKLANLLLSVGPVSKPGWCHCDVSIKPLPAEHAKEWGSAQHVLQLTTFCLAWCHWLRLLAPDQPTCHQQYTY